MASTFIGYDDCNICSSTKVRVTIGEKGGITRTCNGACKSQQFVRGEAGEIIIKARVRKPVEEVAAMPVPEPGQEISVPGVIPAKVQEPAPKTEEAPQPKPAAPKKKSIWSDLYG